MRPVGLDCRFRRASEDCLMALRTPLYDWHVAHRACMVAVQGPKAVALCAGLTTVDPAQLAYYHAEATNYRGAGCVVSRTGYTGEDGVELMIPAEHGPALWEELIGRGARACGLGARD